VSSSSDDGAASVCTSFSVVAEVEVAVYKREDDDEVLEVQNVFEGVFVFTVLTLRPRLKHVAQKADEDLNTYDDNVVVIIIKE